MVCVTFVLSNSTARTLSVGLLMAGIYHSDVSWAIIWIQYGARWAINYYILAFLQGMGWQICVFILRQ